MPGLHSSGTTRESYILRPCLKKNKNQKGKGKRRIYEHSFPRLRDNVILLNANTALFIFCSDNFIRFFILKWQYWNSSMFIYLILSLSSVYTKLLFVNTTMHYTSRSLSSGTRMGKERRLEGMSKDLQATGTRAAATSAVNLAMWLPYSTLSQPGCTVSCEPCGDLWDIQTSNLTMHQHVLNQLSTISYTLLLNYVYNVWLKVSILIFFEYRMF